MRKPNIILLLAVLLYSVHATCQSDSNVIDLEVVHRDAVISASLHLPSHLNQPVPTVIVIPGSDRGTREYFLPYVPAINDIGYAVLLYDKQGIGKSTGDFIQVSSVNSERTIRERAEIVTALVNYLKKSNPVTHPKIGLLASSQGTWVASEVYKTSGNIDFIMNYSGGVASVGASDYYDELMDDMKIGMVDGNAKVEAFTGIKGYDPRSIVRDMKIPVLWVYGELDRSHPALYDKKILETLGKPNFQIELLPNVTHDLIDIMINDISGDMIRVSMTWLSSLNQ